MKYKIKISHQANYEKNARHGARVMEPNFACSAGENLVNSRVFFAAFRPPFQMGKVGLRVGVKAEDIFRNHLANKDFTYPRVYVV